jgi:phage terminase large subunit
MASNFNIFEIKPWEEDLYRPCQYKVYYGGRDSGKSTMFAKALLRLSFDEKCNILCCREQIKDIGKSIYVLFLDIINNVDEYKQFFVAKDNKMLGPHIINNLTGSLIYFEGLRDINVDNIKSIHGIKYLWIEEGHYITQNTWITAIPSIRGASWGNNTKSGCEIWVTMNPKYETDFLYNEFIIKGKDKYKDNLVLKKLSWRHNYEHLSKESYNNLLSCRNDDYELYMHMYEGECIRKSNIHVFSRDFFVIQEFEEPQGIFPYYGIDFGFSDPTAGIRCYIQDENLYITHEYKKTNVTLDILGYELEKSLKDYKKVGKYIATADNARPDLIDMLSKYGYPVKPAIKGRGSIEAGIEYIKTFKKCYVHPRCQEFLKEVYNLKYKTDRHSGQIKDEIEDKNNHLVDSLRYSLEDCMKNRYNDDFKYKNIVDNTIWV